MKATNHVIVARKITAAKRRAAGRRIAANIRRLQKARRARTASQSLAEARGEPHLQPVLEAMEPSGMKRLRAAGWKAGTTTEFVGLSETEAALVERKLARAPRASGANRKGV